MTIERFSKTEFEEELSKFPHLSFGDGKLAMGEYQYSAPLDDKVKVIVRSSIDSTGQAASTGEDSIRLVLLTADGRPLGSAQSYISRVTGWQSRLTDKLRSLINMRTQAGNCENCGKPMKIFKTEKPGPNKGRWFAKCDVHNNFKWIINDTSEPSEQKNSRAENSVVDESDTNTTIQPENRSKVSIFNLVEDKQENSEDEIEDTTRPSYVLPDVRQIAFKQSVLLDPHQQAVVDARCKGAAVVEAIPGSGKTRTLENLIASLIADGENPERMGAFTFAQKAAEEMRVRIARTIWPDVTPEELDFFANPKKKQDGVETETFNSEWIDKDPIRRFLVDRVCTISALQYRMLKASGHKFSIIDGRKSYEADNLIKDAIAELDWDEAPRAVMMWINTGLKHMVASNDSYSFFYQALQKANGPVVQAGNLSEVYKRFCLFMRKNNLYNFVMLSAIAEHKMITDAPFRNKAQASFDYILVDEAQDTDAGQADYLWTMAGKSCNILYVGDADQSMYRWRGAVPEVLRELFDERWGTVTRFSLPINYRSTQSIVRLSEKLITNNYLEESVKRFLKAFKWKETAPIGEQPKYMSFSTFDGLSNECTNIIANDGNFGDFFVLSRTRAECSAIHTALIAKAIPAINKSGGLVFGGPHVRKVIAYAQLGCNYHNARDNQEVLKEVANVASSKFLAPITRRRHVEGCSNDKPWQVCGCPIIMEEGNDYSNSRYYGAKAIEQAGNWHGVIEQMYEKNRGGFPSMQSKGAKDLVGFVERIASLKDDAYSALRLIIDDCVMPWLAKEEGIDIGDLSENGKAEDFDLLMQMANKPEISTLEDFLAQVDMLSTGGAEGNEKDSVLVGTIHWSKGAERPSVIVNMTRLPIVPPPTKEGRLPTGKPPTIEEERNLLFVAITRAKDNCYILHSDEWNGMPIKDNPFARELGF